MHKPLAVLAAFGLAGASLIATPSTASAVDCTINNFSPRSVAIGLAEVSPRFSVSLSSGCDSSPWTLQGETFNANNQSRSFTFAVPTSNSAATSQGVVVQAYVKGGGSTKERTFDNGFTIKRATGWDQVSLKEHDQGRSAVGTVKGRLRIANWSTRRYVAYTKQTVALEFDDSATSSGWVKVKTAKTNSSGVVTVPFTTDSNGSYRLRYGGNSHSGASTSRTVRVQVPLQH
jgi:hypothetical protein